MESVGRKGDGCRAVLQHNTTSLSGKEEPHMWEKPHSWTWKQGLLPVFAGK